MLFGLTHEHDAAAIGYAVIEGVSFGLADGWTSLQATRDEVAALSLVGGGARSGLWAQLLASTLGITLRIHEGGEAGAALGAARLAWLADGGDEAEVCRTAPLVREFEPRADEATLLASRYQRYQALYPALRNEFASERIAGPVPVSIR